MREEKSEHHRPLDPALELHPPWSPLFNRSLLSIASRVCFTEPAKMRDGNLPLDLLLQLPGLHEANFESLQLRDPTSKEHLVCARAGCVCMHACMHACMYTTHICLFVMCILVSVCTCMFTQRYANVNKNMDQRNNVCAPLFLLFPPPTPPSSLWPGIL